jgi:hypothetical protein
MSAFRKEDRLWATNGAKRMSLNRKDCLANNYNYEEFNSFLTKLVGITKKVVNNAKRDVYIPMIFILNDDNINSYTLFDEKEEGREVINIGDKLFFTVIYNFGKSLRSQEAKKPDMFFLLANCMPHCDAIDRNEIIIIWGYTSCGKENAAYLKVHRTAKEVIVCSEEPCFYYSPNIPSWLSEYNLAKIFYLGFYGGSAPCGAGGSDESRSNQRPKK